MQIPETQARAFGELRPDMRFCWIGGKRHGDEENPGCFGLIMLLDQDKAGPRVARMELVDYDEVINKGPIFAKDGTPDKRDWATNLRPYLSYRLDGTRAGLGFDTEMVINGEFVDTQRRKMAPQSVLDRRQYDHLIEKGLEADRAIEESSRAVANQFEFENRFNPSYTLMDKETIKKELPKDFDPKGPSMKNFYLDKMGGVGKADSFLKPEGV